MLPRMQGLSTHQFSASLGLILTDRSDPYEWHASSKPQPGVPTVNLLATGVLLQAAWLQTAT